MPRKVIRVKSAIYLRPCKNEQQSPSRWNETSRGRDCEGDCRSWRIAVCALMLWLITQLHECGNQFLSLLNRNIKVLSSCFGTGNAISSIAIHVSLGADSVLRSLR